MPPLDHRDCQAMLTNSATTTLSVAWLNGRQSNSRVIGAGQGARDAEQQDLRRGHPDPAETRRDNSYGTGLESLIETAISEIADKRERSALILIVSGDRG
jgi:hypothetical protein